MATTAKMVGLIALVVLTPPFAYATMRGVAVLKQGYGSEEMDWNQDGSVTLAEFFHSSEIGKREQMSNGRPCFDYFSYKDGSTIKLRCH